MKENKIKIELVDGRTFVMKNGQVIHIIDDEPVPVEGEVDGTDDTEDGELRHSGNAPRA